LAVVIGSAVATVFRRDGGRPRLPAAVVQTAGRIPTAGDLRTAVESLEVPPRGSGGDFGLVVSAAGAPRVTIDGRSSLNGPAIRATASAVLQAGGILAGPLPSDTTAVDLFSHELTRQAPDVLILTQPIAGDKLRLLTRFLEHRPVEDRLIVIYNGPSGYRHVDLETSPGCEFAVAPSVSAAGRISAGATRRLLAAAVSAHLGTGLAWAGYSGAAFEAMGPAAVRCALRLAREVAGPAGSPEPRSHGRLEAATADLCFLVIEPEQATAFLPFEGGVDAASAGLAGTGTVDLVNRTSGRSAADDGGDWLPSWPALAARLPLDLDADEAANLAGQSLVQPWSLAGSETLSYAAAAMTEELLARLASKWPRAVRPETNPSGARLIAATGAALARLGDARLGASAVIGGLQPGGVTVVAVDPWGLSLLGQPPEITVTCLSPLRTEHDSAKTRTDPWAVVTLERENSRATLRRLWPGHVSAIPLPPGERGLLTIEPCLPKLDFGAGPGRLWRGPVYGGTAGLILDGRGRPFTPPPDPILRIAQRREFLAAFGVLDRTRWRKTAGTREERG
jgi:hypothetical protein